MHRGNASDSHQNNTLPLLIINTINTMQLTPSKLAVLAACIGNAVAVEYAFIVRPPSGSVPSETVVLVDAFTGCVPFGVHFNVYWKLPFMNSTHASVL